VQLSVVSKVKVTDWDSFRRWAHSQSCRQRTLGCGLHWQYQCHTLNTLHRKLLQISLHQHNTSLTEYMKIMCSYSNA